MRTTRYHGKACGRRMKVESLERRLLLAGDCHFADDSTEEYALAVRSINCFAVEMYEYLQAETGNLVVSPASLSTALAMFYAGTAGESAVEMEEVLRLGDDGNVHSSFAALREAWDGNAPIELDEFQQFACDSFPELVTFCDVGGGYNLELANAFWPAEGVTIKDGFQDTVENDYLGAVRNVDYSTPEATDIINDWVNERTRGKIETLYSEPLPANTVMTLANSVYFRSLWAAQFDPDSTVQSPFTLANGSTVDVPMMQFGATTSIDEVKEGVSLPTVRPFYTQIDGFEILDRQLMGELSSMVFIMPTDPNAANELTPELLVKIDEWMSSPRDFAPVHVSLPKFEITSTIDLLPMLSGLMPTTFPGGDYSNMMDGDFLIHDARQKVFLEVNEQGTEAAAVTAFSGLLCFAAGTPILTPDGVQPIEALSVGDFVLSRDEFNEHGGIRRKKIEECFRGEAEIWAVHLGGKEIRVTDAHRFFLKDRGWTPANEISVGDLIASTDVERHTRVEQVRCTGEIEPVYNFRVADDHTYFVGDEDWEFDVWTHNEYGFPDLCPIPEFRVDRPFHFVIRENETSSILFMGRIDDPTQMNSNVRPTVPSNDQQSGDFDGDESLDSSDADALVAAILSGKNDGQFDLTADGTVDGQDLNRWRSLAGAANLPSGAAYPRGDANLDGKVNSLDLNVVGRNWRQLDARFSGGDLNADGIVDVVDLNRIGSGWLEDVSGADVAASERIPRAALVAVIDPSLADPVSVSGNRTRLVNHVVGAIDGEEAIVASDVEVRATRYQRHALNRRATLNSPQGTSNENFENVIVNEVFELWN